MVPEGPEVRRIAQALAQRISGRTLMSVEIVSGRYEKKEPSGWGIFLKLLPQKIIGAGSHGKFMYWLLDDEISIWSTLGMSGQWGVEPTHHTRLKFHLNDGIVYYNDQRNFGTLKCVRGKFALIEKLTSLGPDMLAEDVENNKFIKQLRKKGKWEITKALMDQAVVAGVGNYIKADSLWLAKISPRRMIVDISDGELVSINRAIKQIMRESYKSGGSTVKAYEQFNDSTHEYRRQFLVYNQLNDPDGNDVIKEMTADNRITHWCPAVQF